MNIRYKIASSPMMTLTFWTIFGQLITFAISPLTTRLFNAAEFGSYTLISSVVSLVMPILSLKFDSLIVSESEEEAAYISVIISFVVILFSSIITLISYNFYTNISSIRISNFQNIIFFLILIVTGISNIGVAFANRIEYYSLIGKYNFLRSLFQNVLLVVFGYLNFSINGMLLALLIGNFFGFVRIMRTVPTYKILNKKRDKKQIKKFFFMNVALLKYSFPAHFINSLSYTILNFLIASLYGNSIFGYYSLSFRILGLPLSLITQNISKVFFRDASKEWNNERSIENTLKKYTIILLLLSVPFSLIAFLVSPKLFSIIFGSSWVTTGIYVRILSSMFGVRLIVSSLMNYFIIVKEQSKELCFQSIFLVVSVVAFFVVKSLKLEIEIFLILISVGYSIVYFLIYFYIFKNRRKNND